VNGFHNPDTLPEPPIFVVDPDVGQRRFIGGVLGRGGFRIESLATGEEALAAARREAPRLVVLEVRLTDISGYEVCRALKDWFGDAIGVVFTSRDRTEPSDRVAGLMLGADDYLDKPLAGDELLARVRGLVRRVAQHADALPLAGRGGRNDLTRRELDVLRLLAEGLDQGTIADRLYIAPKTVGKHIEHILRKLPARSRAEAVAIAYQRGLVGQ
jgi:DNA-binding NarL/FixJ family response regulator